VSKPTPTNWFLNCIKVWVKKNPKSSDFPTLPLSSTLEEFGSDKSASAILDAMYSLISCAAMK